VEKRLALLEHHQAAVVKKDEGLAALIGLKTFAGKADEAIALLQGRTFNIWEGGTAFDTGQAWVDAQLVRGLHQLGEKQYREALASFEAALKPPASLRAEPRGGSRLPEIAYWIGCTHEALGNGDQARQSWNKAVAFTAPVGGGGRGPGNPFAAGIQRYYQLRAQQKLGRTENVAAGFRELVASATAALNPAADTKDAPGAGRNRTSPRTRLATAHFVAGLGRAGLGETDKAREEFTAALTASPDHLGARLALENLP
jgi:tetratricopeptide (TPR) repeat protein